MKDAVDRKLDKLEDMEVLSESQPQLAVPKNDSMHCKTVWWLHGDREPSARYGPVSLACLEDSISSLPGGLNFSKLDVPFCMPTNVPLDEPLILRVHYHQHALWIVLLHSPAFWHNSGTSHLSEDNGQYSARVAIYHLLPWWYLGNWTTEEEELLHNLDTLLRRLKENGRTKRATFGSPWSSTLGTIDSQGIPCSTSKGCH